MAIGGLTGANQTALLGGVTDILNGVFDRLTNQAGIAGVSGTGAGSHGDCDILNLSVGPLDLNLLGLDVEADDCSGANGALGGPIKVGNDHLLVVLKDRHAATRDEFEKEKSTYLGILLAKKRDDAQVNYLNALRDGLQKGDLVIEQRYVEGEKKGAPGDNGAPPPMPYEE